MDKNQLKKWRGKKIETNSYSNYKVLDKSKKLEIEVKCCYECPYMRVKETLYCQCRLASLRKNLMQTMPFSMVAKEKIPDWCPLPDNKDNSKALFLKYVARNQLRNGETLQEAAARLLRDAVGEK